MSWEFYRHMPVYLPGGTRFGLVEEVGHGVDYLHIRQGSFLVRDWYVPVHAVGTVNDQGVFLQLSAHDLKRSGWNVPAEEYLMRQGATPGYEYTSAADIPPYAKRDASEAPV